VFVVATGLFVARKKSRKKKLAAGVMSFSLELSFCRSAAALLSCRLHGFLQSHGLDGFCV
jgi:hypothetical protein